MVNHFPGQPGFQNFYFMDFISSLVNLDTGNKVAVKEFDITNATQKVDFRSRGRQAKVRVSCDSNGTSWRWGSLRLALQGDGRR